MRALKNFDKVLQGLGCVLFRSGLGEVLPLRLNWRSLRGWSVRTMKIFAGRNTKTSGIEPRIVLRASAISGCELTVLLSARSAFE
jgi:hypothetical protein